MRLRGACLATLLLLAAAPAAAQDSGIAGAVTDDTGGVLPGVAVEAASPVLIEGSRLAVTDARGRYAFTALRPGVYTVTFTLTGFTTVVREGVELTAGFTAPLNAALAVGALEETVTVSGRSPVIDVQRVQERQVVTRDVLDSLPMNKDWGAIGALTVGVAPESQDVGGVRDSYMPYLAAHGGDTRDGMRQMDGLTMGNLSCGYSCTTLNANDAQTEELSYEIGAISADVAIGGVRVNIIPKEGGNTFSGSAFGNFSDRRFQGDNLGQDLIDAGLRSPDVVSSIWDTSFDLGGPVVRDRLWFHGAYRNQGLKKLPANTFYDTDPNDFVFEPDLTRPGVDEQYDQSASLRFTWQATRANKFAVYYNGAPRHQPYQGVSNRRTPEAARDQRNPLNWHGTTTWTGAVGNRILLEAGMGMQVQDATIDPQPDAPRLHAVRELTTGIDFRGVGFSRRWNEVHRAYKASMSYVTGSHNLKFGMTLDEGTWRQGTDIIGPTDSLLFTLGGAPILIAAFATPYNVEVDLAADLGLYAQDAWTIDRTTFNLGLRWDYVRQDIPAQDTSRFVDSPTGSVGPGTWAPTRRWDAIPNAANWTDLSPRIGVAHDLFGDGRTALKGSVSRYLRVDTIGMSASRNPVNASVTSATRSWRDLNGDFFPDEDELGPYSNANFGRSVLTNVFAEDVYSGFGTRRHNWEYSVGVEQEILPRTSIDVAYWRRAQGNFSVTDNVLVEPGDFDPYCVTAPDDPRLPGGGGYEVCGLHDVNPASFGQVRNEIIRADTNGYAMSQVFDGLDVTVNSRVSGDLFFYGGVNFGRTRFDDCGARPDDPAAPPTLALTAGGAGTGGGWDVQEAAGIILPRGHHCRVDPPFFRPGWKLSGAYTLPYDVQLSGFWQNLPGVPIFATWNAPVSAIEPSLGRPLAGGAGTAEVHLIAPGTLFADRLNQLDVRVSKIFRLAAGREVRLMLDAYNLLNDDAPLAVNDTYGSQWQVPESILLARFVKFGAQFTW